MRLNYLAAVQLIMGFLPGMAERRAGHVVNISSIGALTTAPRFSAYVGSKAALEGWTDCAASEFLDRGVAFTNVNMPLVRTARGLMRRGGKKLVCSRGSGDAICRAPIFINRSQQQGMDPISGNADCLRIIRKDEARSEVDAASAGDVQQRTESDLAGAGPASKEAFPPCPGDRLRGEPFRRGPKLSALAVGVEDKLGEGTPGRLERHVGWRTKPRQGDRDGKMGSRHGQGSAQLSRSRFPANCPSCLTEKCFQRGEPFFDGTIAVGGQLFEVAVEFLLISVPESVPV